MRSKQRAMDSCKLRFGLKAIIVFCLVTYSSTGFAQKYMPLDRLKLTKHITTYYAEQLTNPQKKNRKSLSQFGYNLSLGRIPLFPITSFIHPDKFGVHSYGQPHPKEKNGVIYTCRGGFIDFSHVRCAADWTVFLAFKMIADSSDFDLEPEAGSLKLHFQHSSNLLPDDVVALAQKIAFERLLWHEIASWHYHPPNFMFSEQQSAFTPEDLYSNFIGTMVGKEIALRILKSEDTLSYTQIATEEIEQMMATLNPLKTKKESASAYDIVNRSKQLKLPEGERNKDVWWDNKIVFSDQRYVFKRSMDIGPEISPWLVPSPNKIGCPTRSVAEVLKVPQKTKAGVSFHKYYQLIISPDSVLFYSKRNNEELHPPFNSFFTQQMDVIMQQISEEMSMILLADFDKRNSVDPVPHYKGIKRVL